MKKSNRNLSLTLIITLLVGVSTSGEALAHGGGRGGGGWHGGARVGIYLGAPIGFNYGYYPYSYYGPAYYGIPNYYPTAPVYYPPIQSVPTYTQQSESPQISPQVAPKNSSQDVQGSWWYFCVDAKAYYPYVKQCPGGWLRVASQPAPGSYSQPALNNVPAP